MKNKQLNNQIFIQNRARFASELKSGGIAIFESNALLYSNGDATYPFAQNSDLYWLTGIRQPDTMLILFPEDPHVEDREILVLSRPEPLKEKWNGRQLRAAEASKISGIQKIIWRDEVDHFLQLKIHLSRTIYLNSNENDHRNPAFQWTSDYLFAQKIRQQYPLHQFERAAVILKKLRPVKTAEEVEVMQRAMDITENTFRHLLQFIRPDVFEYEIEGEILQQFLSQRADGEAYPSIIASGDRARTLHYIFNDQQCKDGELVLMDFGARYGNYCADITRTIPVNGKFTPRQKELYNTCLELHNYTKSILRPGLNQIELMQKFGDKATELFLQIQLLQPSDVQNEDPSNRAYRRYMYHGVSHQLGIDVHDLYPAVSMPFQKGMVMTIEPGIYIEEEEIGIRIENNVLLTENGNIDLTKNIPITAEEIESLMKK